MDPILLGGLAFAVAMLFIALRMPIGFALGGVAFAATFVLYAWPAGKPLGLAQAVPSERVPLPGAYSRSPLPELERRIASGELSLRGVNPRTIDVDASLLADADTPARLTELAAR